VDDCRILPMREGTRGTSCETTMSGHSSSNACCSQISCQYWSGHVWHKTDHKTYKHLPDVGHNIEVRRVRTSTNGAVRRRQLDQGLVLWIVRPVAPEFRVVEILGWIDHDEAWEKGEPSGYDPENTRVIGEEFLSPPTDQRPCREK